ncbi:hypothetical protein J4441_02425 [Candidatus Micrarchaeota archaeon]|nr:hypothetical protein [Candidatus Micrarchaeota archaeon]
MKSTMLQYDRSVEEAVERLLQLGVFTSKADIFRVGAMELALKYGLVKSKDEVIEEMMYKDAESALRRLKSGKAKLHKIEEI